jgi:hypothetical protein
VGESEFLQQPHGLSRSHLACGENAGLEIASQVQGSDRVADDAGWGRAHQMIQDQRSHWPKGACAVRPPGMPSGLRMGSLGIATPWRRVL